MICDKSNLMGLASSQIGRGWQFLWHLWWAIRWWYAKYQHFVGKTHAKNRPVTKFVMSMSRKSCKTFSGSAASTRDKTVQSCIILHTTCSRYFFNSFSDKVNPCLSKLFYPIIPTIFWLGASVPELQWFTGKWLHICPAI